MQYSIVIPAHNEASNLAPHVTSFITELPPAIAKVLKEIIIVENGSTDETLDVCRSLAQQFPSLVKVVTIPRGSYGEAIKQGMLESRGTHLSILECDFMDSDFVARSIAMFRSGSAQLIVGSKRHSESVDRRPLKRRALTALYNVILLRLFIGYPGTDTHGLKSIEAECARGLCKAALTTDEVFQTEIVLLAWRLGITINEIPVDISEIRTAPVTVLRRVPKVLDTVRQLKKSLQRFPKREGCSSVAGSSSKKAAAQEEEMLAPMKDEGSPPKSSVHQIS
jgi:glycosyltransferase involved in cell wall biosynthesis